MTAAAPGAAFASLPLKPPLLQALEVLAFSTMTPVQQAALPTVLAGGDVIAQARTGSGKTVAFGLGLLSRVDVGNNEVQALVLVPTRELADQVASELRRLARFVPNLRVVTLCGGVPVRTQVPSLQSPPHVVVGTPGRILDHLQRETLHIDRVRTLVLDEADRMLDMGFLPSIEDIVAGTSAKRQTLLFSATYPSEVRSLSTQFQRQPTSVTVDDGGTNKSDIEQLFFEVEPAQRLAALTQLLLAWQPESALVFCHTKNDVRDVTARLQKDGYGALALHGDLEQRERDEVVVRFANKSCTVLVATDVAARGLDIRDLAAVISWELPVDPDTHLHRIGRTGRAGKKGHAWALYTSKERSRLGAIEETTGPVSFAPLPVPTTSAPRPAPMRTLIVEGGRQDKLRPGDLLGALTGDLGLEGDVVGKIDITPRYTYVAIRRDVAESALSGLRGGKIKGRSFRVWDLG